MVLFSQVYGSINGLAIILDWVKDFGSVVPLPGTAKGDRKEEIKLIYPPVMKKGQYLWQKWDILTVDANINVDNDPVIFKNIIKSLQRLFE